MGSDSGPRPGSTVIGLDFLYSFENTAAAPYYPLEGLAGCSYSPDGTLIFCDELRGKVFGLDPSTRRWFEFAAPNRRSFNPVDVRVDGFRVLVLDQADGSIQHFDLSGAWRDELVDVRQLDPGAVVHPSCFAVDQDGRMVIGDAGQQEVLLLDSFLGLHTRVGGPGPMDDQFQDPAGIVFRNDGSFLVSDRGNRRLSLYGRNGFFEGAVGGDFDRNNPFLSPRGLDVDRFGNVFVADQGSGLIHVMDRRLHVNFSAGHDFDLAGTPLAPVDLAVGPNDELAVTDRARSAILVYRIIYQ
ncbi:MAG: NHL repeat-containing protein [Gemmatimonadales bacterium]|nr:NHL repeat-containing protein [Gemmatimonadales bacterium]